MKEEVGQGKRISLFDIKKPESLVTRVGFFYELLQKYETWVSWSSVKNQVRDCFDAFFCPDCGAEVYAHWEDCIWAIAFLENFSNRMPLHGASLSDEWCSEMDAIKSDYEKHNQFIKSQRDKYFQSTCPICGGKYSEISFHGSVFDVPQSYRDGYGYIHWRSSADDEVDLIFSYIRSQHYGDEDEDECEWW